jgi:protein-tyrosine kinase
MSIIESIAPKAAALRRAEQGGSSPGSQNSPGPAPSPSESVAGSGAAIPLAGVVDADGAIGAILIRAGLLSFADAEAIVRCQEESGLRFGEAGLQLGLLTHADIGAALARQFDYPYLVGGNSAVSPEVVAAYAPFSARAETLRALRSQLMQRWLEPAAHAGAYNAGVSTSDEPRGSLAVAVGGRALAITSAGAGDGRSTLAANLAVVFSQQGQRTLLIDADLRQPCQHRLFGLTNRQGLSSLLIRRGSAEAIQPVVGLHNLCVITAGAPAPNPLELLGRPLFATILQELADDFDVILIDTPAGAQYADAQTVATRAGAALILAQQDGSRLRAVHDFVTGLQASGVFMVGSVLRHA